MNKKTAFAFFLAAITFAACTDKKQSETIAPSVSQTTADAVSQQPDISDEEMAQFLEMIKEEINQMSVEELKTILDSTLLVMSEQLPIDTGYGMTMTDITYENDAVTYLIVFDEKEISLEELKQEAAEQLKTSLLGGGTDPQNEIFFTICKRTATDLVFDYVGSESGEEFVLRVKSDEI